MFNHEQKIKFIKMFCTSGKDRSFVTNMFEIIASVEEAAGIDVSFFNYSQACSADKALKEVYHHFVSRREAAIHWIIKYNRWCRSIGLSDAQDSFVELLHDEIEEVRLTSLVSPQDLEMCLDEIFGTKATDGYPDILIRAYCWFLFCGIKVDDFLDLKVSNVDLENMEIVLDNGRRVPLYREAYSTVRLMVRLKDFNWAHAHPNQTKEETNYTRRMRMDNDYLFRGISKKGSKPRVSEAYLRTGLIKEQNKAAAEGRLRKRLFPFGITRSGVFCRAYERERLGIEFSVSDEADLFLRTSEIERSISKPSHLQSLAVLEREYSALYKRWKLAFNI